MTGFRRVASGGLILWRGDPCQAVHDFMLAKLQPHAASFIGPNQAVTNAQKGNLGEFITFWVGHEHDHASLQVFKPANAFQPLNTISRSGLDMLWVHFADYAEHDFAVLQEIKVTGSTALTYANTLPTDYQKLFGTDPQVTLQTRLLDAKNELEYVIGKPEFVTRLTRLGGVSPQSSPKIRLIPTLIHDEAGADPEVALQVVKATIVGLGWDASHVQPWSLALDSLDDRLNRLGRGSS